MVLRFPLDRLRRRVTLALLCLAGASGSTTVIYSFNNARAQTQPTLPSEGLASDIQPTRSRLLKLDVEYSPERRASIAFVELIASADQGQTWRVMDTVTADKDFLKFEADQDGLYFVNMVMVFKDGTRDPIDPSRVLPELKLLVDTTPPKVQITDALPQMDEIHVSWQIEELHLDQSKTQLQYKSSGSVINDWVPVPSAQLTKQGARFKPTISGPLLVRLVVQDLAGNVTEATKEVPVGLTASYTPSQPTGGTNAPLILPTNPASIPAPDFSTVRTNATAPSSINLPGPVAPPSFSPPAVAPAPLNVQPVATPAAAPITAPATIPSQPLPQTSQTLGTQAFSTPTANPTPLNAQQAWSQVNTSPVIGVSTTQMAPPANTPATTTTSATGGYASAGPAFNPIDAGSANPIANNRQYLRSAEFSLSYELIDTGPSGISKIDLYVTRDEGRTWQKWSSHSGQESPLRVKLATAFNSGRDGDYGLRIVPVSGAGLTDDPPTPGTPPELWVHVDLTPPLLSILAPVPSGTQANGLVLQWQATDANFGPTPIKIEWSESNAGPWQLVTNDDQLNQRGEVPNTGQFTWYVPRNLPTHRVFLKMTATDLAGNVTVAVTSQPISIDLIKPKARLKSVEAK